MVAGDEVRLLRPWAGLAAGSRGVLLGWYAYAEPMALVSFWDSGPLRVPSEAIAAVGDDARSEAP